MTTIITANETWYSSRKLLGSRGEIYVDLSGIQRQEPPSRVISLDDEIERIEEIDPVSGRAILSKDHTGIFPAQHYVTSSDAINKAAELIEKELTDRVAELESAGRIAEAQRLKMRTKYDLEMLLE